MTQAAPYFFSVNRIENDLYQVTVPIGWPTKEVKRTLIKRLWRDEPLRNIGVSNLILLGYRRNGVGEFKHAIIEVVE